MSHITAHPRQLSSFTGGSNPGAGPGESAGVGSQICVLSSTLLSFDQKKQERLNQIQAAVDYVFSSGLPASKVCSMFNIPQATLYRHVRAREKQQSGDGAYNSSICEFDIGMVSESYPVSEHHAQNEGTLNIKATEGQ